MEKNEKTGVSWKPASCRAEEKAATAARRMDASLHALVSSLSPITCFP
ncbi:MAG: hypothetical protein QXX19_05930 [Candidatus Caldarchaeum sp.]